MNNIKKIKRVINVSDPLLVGDTLYVANATGKTSQTEETAFMEMKKYDELDADSRQKIKDLVCEYAKYYIEAATYEEKAEVKEKFFQLCADLNCDDPMLQALIDAEIMQKAPEEFIMLDNPPVDGGMVVEPDLDFTSGKQLNTARNFFEQYKTVILVGIIVLLLINKK